MQTEPHDFPKTDPEEMQELAGLVAEAIAKGDPTEEIVADLTNNGWEHQAASEFVNSIEFQVFQMQEQEAKSNSSDGMGWLIWIGVIIGVNVLSYLFNWGFWIY